MFCLAKAEVNIHTKQQRLVDISQTRAAGESHPSGSLPSVDTKVRPALAVFTLFFACILRGVFSLLGLFSLSPSEVLDFVCFGTKTKFGPSTQEVS